MTTTKLTDWEICALQTAMRQAIANHPGMIEHVAATALLAKLDRCKTVTITEHPRSDIFGSVNLTEEQAKALATMGPKYRARKMRGFWCVWDDIADHIVTFDDVPGCLAAIAAKAKR